MTIKKVAIFTLCAASALSLVACGKKTTKTNNTTTNNITTTAKATTTKKTTTQKVTVDTTKMTLSFDTKGGNTIASMQVPAGGTITMPEAPVKDGYKFLGWYEDVACEGKEFTSTIMPNYNITLYAKWKEYAKLTSPAGQIYSSIGTKFTTNITEDNKNIIIEGMELDPNLSAEEVTTILESFLSVSHPIYTFYFLNDSVFAMSTDKDNITSANILESINKAEETELNTPSYAYTVDDERNLNVSLTPGGSHELDMFAPESVYVWYFEEGFGGLVMDSGLYQFVFPLLEVE